jgi:hypothetical protein
MRRGAIMSPAACAEPAIVTIAPHLRGWEPSKRAKAKATPTKTRRRRRKRARR